MKKTKIAMMAMTLAIPSIAMAQGPERVRYNQVGYLPQEEKYIVADHSDPRGRVAVTDENGKVVSKPMVLRIVTSPFGDKSRYVMNLGKITKPGDYFITFGNNRAKFHVEKNAYRKVAKAALKSFYLMRSAIDIKPQYAGAYARKGGHRDGIVYIHESAESSGRPAGSTIASPFGWYDAGDYNKYVVNSAYSIGLMLNVYQQIPDYFDKLNTNIPESENKTADFLDEMMYNLKWLLTMQDPADGGVYHKLTTPDFEGFIMPDQCKQKRYVVAKSVTAAYDFAAIMAQAARIFKGNKDYPDFTEKAEKAAVAAYEWARLHPDEYYDQDEMNKKYSPKINTGTYGDKDAKDEHFWAATELYFMTDNNNYLKEANELMPSQFTNSSWGNVAELGLFEWIQGYEDTNRNTAIEMLKDYMQTALRFEENSCFQSPFGNTKEDFGWGCLGGNCCFPAIAMLYADKYIERGKYRKYALENVDYLIGRNATGYCYITGFGDKSPKHPHHRISEKDMIEAPFPGLLVGGPNPGQQDKGNNNLTYPSNVVDESYVDCVDSYASNEIAINWNAALVGLLCWIDAES